MTSALHSASHVFEEHTGEVQMRLEAPTLGELFAEAARALMEVMGGAPPPPAAAAGASAERVSVSSVDRDALLVDWLNELIYRVETGKKLYGEFVLHMLSDRELSATIRGVPMVEPRTLVKAASFHGLKITGYDVGYTATVVLDV